MSKDGAEDIVRGNFHTLQSVRFHRRIVRGEDELSA